jgi:hypothetical protein
MEISFFKKQLFMLFLILSPTICAPNTRECIVDNCAKPVAYAADSCCLPFFDCGCWSAQFQAGIAPIVWVNRGSFQIVSCLISGNNCQIPTCGPIIPIFEMPKFSDLYHLPWTVGGAFGYAITECSEVYIEGNYRAANSKCFEIGPNINVGTFIAQTNFSFNQVSKYSLYDLYIGVRTYSDLCWCDALTGFWGFQVGLIHHKSVRANITTSSDSNACAAPFTATCVELFPRHTAFAGGANIGFEYCFGCGFSLVFTAEIIATCGPNGNQNVPFNGCTADIVLPEIRPTNFIIGGIGTEMLFPFTLGLKYSF